MIQNDVDFRLQADNKDVQNSFKQIEREYKALLKFIQDNPLPVGSTKGNLVSPLSPSTSNSAYNKNNTVAPVSSMESLQRATVKSAENLQIITASTKNLSKVLEKENNILNSLINTIKLFDKELKGAVTSFSTSSVREARKVAPVFYGTREGIYESTYRGFVPLSRDGSLVPVSNTETTRYYDKAAQFRAERIGSNFLMYGEGELERNDDKKRFFERKRAYTLTKGESSIVVRGDNSSSYEDAVVSYSPWNSKSRNYNNTTYENGGPSYADYKENWYSKAKHYPTSPYKPSLDYVQRYLMLGALRYTADAVIDMDKTYGLSLAASTDEDREWVRKNIKSASYGHFSARSWAPVYLSMQREGIDISNIYQDKNNSSLKLVENAGLASGIDLQSANDLVGGVARALGLNRNRATDSKKLSRVMDIITYTANATALDLPDMAQYIAKDLPIESLLGSDIVNGKDPKSLYGLAAFTTLVSSGMGVSKTATGLKSLSVSVPTRRSAGAREVYKILGIDIDKDILQAGLQLPEIVHLINKKLAVHPELQDIVHSPMFVSQISGKEHVSIFLKLLDMDRKIMQQASDSLNNSKDANQKMATLALTPLYNSVLEFQKSRDKLINSFSEGGGGAEVLGDFLAGTSHAMNVLADVLDKGKNHPVLRKIGEGVIGWESFALLRNILNKPTPSLMRLVWGAGATGLRGVGSAGLGLLAGAGFRGLGAMGLELLAIPFLPEIALAAIAGYTGYEVYKKEIKGKTWEQFWDNSARDKQRQYDVGLAEARAKAKKQLQQKIIEQHLTGKEADMYIEEHRTQVYNDFISEYENTHDNPSKQKPIQETNAVNPIFTPDNPALNFVVIHR